MMLRAPPSIRPRLVYFGTYDGMWRLTLLRAFGGVIYLVVVAVYLFNNTLIVRGIL